MKNSPKDSLSVPVHLYIAKIIDEAQPEIKRDDLAKRMGYALGNVVSMLKNGSMKMPVNKVKILADAVGVEPIALLRRVMLADNPGTWAVIEEILGAQLVTKNELALLTLIRPKLNGVDVDFLRDKDFTGYLELMAEELLDRELHSETVSSRVKKPARAGSLLGKLNEEMTQLLHLQAIQRQKLRKKITDEVAVES